MESAFGIDHGTVSKAYKKLAPKLKAALQAEYPLEGHKTIAQRSRWNYAMGRDQAGSQGKIAGRSLARIKRGINPNEADPARLLDAAKVRGTANKEFSAAAGKAHANITRRKGRSLP